MRTVDEPQGMPWGSLILLAATGFIAVATETLPIGLLPVMATDFGVSQAKIGVLVSVYAAAVVIASVPLNAWTTRLPRRPLLMALVGIYAVSNVALFLTTSYSLAAAARVLGGMAHALFFSLMFGYTTALVPKQRLGTALATVGAGNALAIGVGTPLGTLIGTAFGWRTTFGGVAVISTALVVLIRFRLPALPGSELPGGSQLREVIARRPFRWLELATLLTVGGIFASYTYLSPIMIEFGYRVGTVGIALLIYGVTALLSLLAFGRLANRQLRFSLPIGLSLLTVIFLIMAVLPHSTSAGTGLVIGWGLAAGSLTAYIQTAVIRAAADHPATASAIHNSIFNVGIGGGALLGGRLLMVSSATSLGFASAIALALSVPIWWHWIRRAEAQPT